MTKTTSRRAVLAGAAALPALAAPALAKAAQSDAKLLALGRDIEALNALCDEAMERMYAASDRFHALKLPPLERPQPPAGYAALYKRITVDQMEMLAADRGDR